MTKFLSCDAYIVIKKENLMEHSVDKILKVLKEEYVLSDVVVRYIKASYWYDYYAESTSMDYSIAEERGEAYKAFKETLPSDNETAFVNGVIAVLRHF